MSLIVGDMKRIKSLKTVFVCICIVWLVFVIVPFIVWLLIPKFSIIKLWSVSFSAATALFTGIAFAVAFYSLYKQKESLIEQQENLKKQQKSLNEQQKALIKQINLRVFTDSMGLLMNNVKFNNCQAYIYSNNFLDDIKKVRGLLKLNEHDPVSLNDFNNACKYISDEKERKKLYDSGENIKYFCNRMEFLGLVVSKEEAAKDLILSYYRYTIKETYEKLNSIIKETRKHKDYSYLYGYYTELYNTINK